MSVRDGAPGRSVIGYLDSSVLLREILRQRDALKEMGRGFARRRFGAYRGRVSSHVGPAASTIG